MVQYLFVYGTLRSAFRNRYARLLSTKSELLGLARVRGRLYDLGRYPALRPVQGHDDGVTGEVYRLRIPSALLTKLDAYEGPLYRRVRTRAVLSEGRTLPVWLYEYPHALPFWCCIASGDYLKR